MKLLIKFAVFLLFLTIFSVAASKVSSEVKAIDTVITFKGTNSGDSPTSHVEFSNIHDGNNRPYSNVNFDVPAYGTASRDIYLFGIDAEPYTGNWLATKQEGPDPRDIAGHCMDPQFSAQAVPFNIGQPAFKSFVVTANFACWKPVAPPYTPPTPLPPDLGCVGSATYVNFKWNKGTSTNYTVDVDDNNFTDGTWWNKNVGNASSAGWSKNAPFDPGGKIPENGKTYYWRLWDGTNHVSGGSFTTRNCGPLNPAVATDCFLGATGVTFSWNPNGLSNFWVDVSLNSGFNGYWGQNVGSSPLEWSAAKPFPGNVAPQPNTTYYWRIWDGVSHTPGPTFTTRPCALPDLISQNLSTSPPNPVVGTPINFTGQTKNIGAGAAGSSHARFCVDAPNDTECLNADPGFFITNAISVGPLGSNAVATYNPTGAGFTWNATTAGPHKVTLCSDVLKVVYESNEGNNCTSINITVGNAPPVTPPPDINLTGFSYCDGANIPRVHLQWTYVNFTDTAVDIARERIYFTNSGGNQWDSADLRGLPGGFSAGAFKSWMVRNHNWPPIVEDEVFIPDPNCPAPVTPTPTTTPTPTLTPTPTPTSIPAMLIDLKGYSFCDGNVPRVHLQWTDNINPPTQYFDIARQGLYFTNNNNVGDFWDSGDLRDLSNYLAGSSRSWRVRNHDWIPIIVESNTVFITDPNCAPAPPAPNCTPASTTAQPNQPVTLSASGGNGTFSWSAPGGSPTSGSGTSFTVSYQTTGTKTVTVTSGGVTDTCQITVNPAAANVSLTGFSYCDAGNVPRVRLQWTDNISPSTTFFDIARQGIYVTNNNNVGDFWNSGDLRNFSNFSAGSSRSWKVRNHNLPAIESNTIFILDPNCAPVPPAPNCTPASTTAQPNQPVTLSASGGNGTFSWSAPGGSPTSGSGTSFTVSYQTTGTKTVTVTSGGVTDTCQITVNPAAAQQPNLAVTLTFGAFAYQPGDDIVPTVTVKNNGPDATNVNVRFYKERNSDPSCGVGAYNAVNNPGGYTDSTNISSILSGASFVWSPATFPAVASGTGYAMILCPGTDSTPNDNIARANYTVNVVSWFETMGGDVGSGDEIRVNYTPDNRYQSQYVLVGKSLSANADRQYNWKLTGYDKKLIPASQTLNQGAVYSFFASRFLGQAADGCSIVKDKIKVCSGDHDMGGTNIGSDTNGVMFVKGNLHITGNITVADSSTAVFLVSGNINVDTSVTKLDGVYIAGKSFYDATNKNDPGSQLNISGSVYAMNAMLQRILGPGATCEGVPCTNSIEPSIKIVFQPKYLVRINQLIGSPNFIWQEIEP